MKAKLTATGHYVPDKIIDNDYLQDVFHINKTRIFERTGIKERRYVEPNITTTDIASFAIKDLLDKSSFKASDIDCIIISTLAPDFFFPSTAVSVINRVKASKAWGFDISAACSGFCYAVNIAKGMIEQGVVKNVIVCGAERMSTMLNNFDYKTSVLFGDGAGAILLEATSDSDTSYIKGGMCVVEADNINDVYFKTPFSSKDWGMEKFELEGYKVFQNGVFLAIQTVKKYIESTGDNKNDFDFIVPHQANMRMIEEIAEGLEFPLNKFLVNIEKYGNTGSASIPICFSQFNDAKKVRKGDRLLFFSLGAGYTISVVDLIF